MLHLTRRQEELAVLVMQGLSNKEIARKLGITTNCVRNHLHNTFHKLGISNRTQLAMWVHARVGLDDHDPHDR